jgi:hypothetical protein
VTQDRPLPPSQLNKKLIFTRCAHCCVTPAVVYDARKQTFSSRTRSIPETVVRRGALPAAEGVQRNCFDILEELVASYVYGVQPCES